MGKPENLSLSARHTRRNLLKMGTVASAVVATLVISTRAMAQNSQGGQGGQGNQGNQGGPRAAPAPSIGSGVPVALSFGGVLLGMKFLTRRRQS